MNDVVYIVGKGSVWADNELKYSLRSLEENLINYNKIVIVGTLPAFVNPEAPLLNFIPYNDVYADKARNIMEKAYVAACNQSLTENILFMNDDYFLLKEIDAINYPYYWKNHLIQAMQKNANNEYVWHLKSTYNVLEKNKKPVLNFDTHCPIIYNRRLLRSVIGSYDWKIKHGYTLRSLYCNTLLIPGEYKEDVKFNRSRLEKEIFPLINGKDCFSIGDAALNKSMKNVLQILYPNKSKWEK